MSLSSRPPSLISNLQYERKSAHHWAYEKLAIAATVILSILGSTALVYLLVWYFRRRLRSRQLRRHQCQRHDIFSQSAVSLAEDTSKTLDEFLMADVQPQRSSIMRRRSRSPSATMVFENSDHCEHPPRPYLTSYDTSTSTLTPVTTLTQVSTQSGPCERNSNTTKNITSEQRSASATPRASTSSMVATAESSQWTTTSATDSGSVLSRDSSHSHYSQIKSSSHTSPLFSRSARANSRRLSIRGSARPSSTGLLYTSPRKLEVSRRTQARTLDADETTPLSPVSPILVDFSVGQDESRLASSRLPVLFSFRRPSRA
jgi:hypothetical protein